MKKVSTAMLVGALSVILGVSGQRPAHAQESQGRLYEGFKNPPPSYDLMPDWYLNGRISVQQAEREIDEMMARGVRHAILYQTYDTQYRFLSEDFWKFWGELLPYARAKGFQLGWNAENKCAVGGANDTWLDTPDQSLVLEGHPEYRMKHLVYAERDFFGAGSVHFENLPNPLVAVAGRITGPSSLDGESLIDLSSGISGSNFSAQLPDGKWRIMFFYLEKTSPPNQPMVADPMNPAAVARYIDLTLGEFYRRYKEYFGNTFTLVYLDAEGDFGNPIAWTPALFDEFKAAKGYDLRKYLPLLAYDGGKITPKVRVDYLRVVSDVYVKSYWEQVGRWCTEHGLQFSGQGLSESLQYDAAIGGDYMEVMRPLTMPGVEALANRGRSPREFVEDQSISDFEKKRYSLEYGVLGWEYYLSPQMLRYQGNMLGIWGEDLWSPNFCMNSDTISWPPDHSFSQPWWKDFRHYSDYVRRISYMNGGGKHAVDLLLYRPLDTTFAYANPVMNAQKEADKIQTLDGWAWGDYPVDSTSAARSTTSKVEDSGYERGAWGMDYYPTIVWNSNFAATVETAYFDLMELLSGYQRAYDVVDDYYLDRMTLQHGRLGIADLSFRGMVLPPMKIISRKGLAKIREFYEQGGLVIAYGSLPFGSSEGGWGDPAIAADVKAIFGVDPGWKTDASNQNSQGGKSYFVVGNVEKVLAPVDQNVPADFQVVNGNRDRVLYLHRVKDNQDLYWVVNDSDQPRRIEASFAARGKPELWDPETGKRKEIAYGVQGERTVIPLNFETWDATYVVFQPSAEKPPEAIIAKTNLEDYRWEPSPTGELVIKGRMRADADKAYIEGTRGGRQFRVEGVNRQRAEVQALPSEGWRFRLEDKQVELNYARQKVVLRGEGLPAGFADPGYNDQTWTMAPLSPQKTSLRDWWVVGPFPNPNTGLYGEGFNTVYPPEKKIDLDQTFIDSFGAEVGWRQYQSDRPETNLSSALGASRHGGAVGYAATWVYAPHDEQVTSITVAKNVKLWVNGELVLARNSNPVYFELKEGFGYQNQVRLKAGWNQILVKVVGSPMVFYVRFTSPDGSPAEDLITALEPTDAEISRQAQATKRADALLERWYRVEAPAGTRALLLPSPAMIEAAYLNGKKVTPQRGRIEYSYTDPDRPPLLALQIAGSRQLEEFLRFESGETSYHLGNWTRTGLSSYAGVASYERNFELAPTLSGHRVWLDCGEVGATAEISLNGQKVGTRVWKPFAVEVTQYLKLGVNHLRIEVANPGDVRRAVPDFQRYLELKELTGGLLNRSLPPYLDVIDMNGLIGPVRLVPYSEVTLSAR